MGFGYGCVYVYECFGLTVFAWVLMGCLFVFFVFGFDLGFCCVSCLGWFVFYTCFVCCVITRFGLVWFGFCVFCWFGFCLDVLGGVGGLVVCLCCGCGLRLICWWW